jgi:4-diphosphocytidyl-2-C-methyl-D-erythritol kinase
MAHTLTLNAHAKLNLALAVGPAQPPKGYHPIASWFVAIDLHDTLTLERLPEGTSSRWAIRWAADAPKPTPIDWPTDQDLAVKAHALLERHAGRPLPLALTLDKRTPVGGGLGGGSSDAAAALVGINRLFQLGLSPRDLAGLSVQLGSDIAFFIDDAPRARPAVVTGLGDRVERLPPILPTDVLLVIPPFGCPTGAVYRAFDLAPTARVDEPGIRALIGAVDASGRIPSRALFNDLAKPACTVEPRLQETLDALRAALGPTTPVYVTGSGSVMFCLPEASRVVRVEELIRQARPELIVVRSRSV